MKVAVLDGFTLNPGDLSWKILQDIADITIYDKTAPDEVYERVKDCEAVLSNKIVFSKELIARLPKLRYIGVLATGYNVIDVEAAHAAGITVTNIPSYSTDSVAQLVFAFILQFYWHVKEHSDEVHGGKWSRSELRYRFGRAVDIEHPHPHHKRNFRNPLPDVPKSDNTERFPR